MKPHHANCLIAAIATMQSNTAAHVAKEFKEAGILDCII